MSDTPRLIWQWTRTQELRHRCREACHECLERIKFGLYKREVYAVSHPHYGRSLEVRVTHQEPACPQLQEY